MSEERWSYSRALRTSARQQTNEVGDEAQAVDKAGVLKRGKAAVRDALY